MTYLEGSPLLQALKRLVQVEILHDRDHLDLEPFPEHADGPVLRPARLGVILPGLLEIRLPRFYDDGRPVEHLHLHAAR